jgi:hypothetical protein
MRITTGMRIWISVEINNSNNNNNRRRKNNNRNKCVRIKMGIKTSTTMGFTTAVSIITHTTTMKRPITSGLIV